MKRSLIIKIKSSEHNINNMDLFMVHILKIAKNNCLKIVGPIPMPIKYIKFNPAENNFNSKEFTKNQKNRLIRIIELIEPTYECINSLEKLSPLQGISLEIKTQAIEY